MSGAILRIFLIVLPLLLYLVWLRYTKKKRAAAAEGSDAAIEAAQVQLAWAVGFLVVVMVAVFAYLAFSGGEDPASEYIPPRSEGGKIIPGEFRPRNKLDGRISGGFSNDWLLSAGEIMPEESVE